MQDILVWGGGVRRERTWPFGTECYLIYQDNGGSKTKYISNEMDMARQTTK